MKKFIPFRTVKIKKEDSTVDNFPNESVLTLLPIETDKSKRLLFSETAIQNMKLTLQEDDTFTYNQRVGLDVMNMAEDGEEPQLQHFLIITDKRVINKVPTSAIYTSTRKTSNTTVYEELCATFNYDEGQESLIQIGEAYEGPDGLYFPLTKYDVVETLKEELSNVQVELETEIA